MNISNYLQNTATMRVIAFILVCLSVFGLSGCGGGGSGGSGSEEAVDTGKSIATGVFLDSAVEGITYISGNISGITDANGTFRYETGGTVRFMIGDLVIGEAQGQGVITPVDFVNGGDASHPTVLNIVRFLLTIDNDGNPNNGIQISEAMRDLARGESITFVQSTASFAADGNVQTLVSVITAATAASARTLVTDSVAQNHLRNTIWNYYAGSYTGTFSGDDSGSFDVTILASGMIVGTGTNSVGTFLVTGQLSTDGSLTFAAGGTSTGASFSGQIDTDGALSGTWNNASESGTFSGNRTSSVVNNEGNTVDEPVNNDTTAGNSIVLSGDIPDYVSGSYTPVPTNTIHSPVTGGISWSNNISDIYAGKPYWMISVHYEGNIVDSILFSWSGLNGSTRELFTYACPFYFDGNNHDCTGATIDINNRTVTFNNTVVPYPDIGSAILNGTLTY